ncbi:MAG TPA: HAD family hydrolase [Candidatus Paceibacterota bacterium]
MTKRKKIIFFDGDGTLWYPKSTRWSRKPHWIYEGSPKPKEYLRLLIVTPGILKILKQLKKDGLLLIALSTHPHPKKEADWHLQQKIHHFKLDVLFDYIYTARPRPEGKGLIMKKVLRKMKIPKSQAVLIGDNYVYDYLSAKKVGVECVLLHTPYLEIPKGRTAKKLIKSWEELVATIE